MPARFHRLVFLATFTAVAPATAGSHSPFGLSAEAGLEYQLITQEYYNALIDTSTLDPIESWILTKDEIDDLIWSTNLGYRLKKGEADLGLETGLELSTDRFIGSAEGDVTWGGWRNFLQWHGRYENKSPFDDSANFDDGYNFFQTYLKGARQLAPGFDLEIKSGFEAVWFDRVESSNHLDSTPSALNFDYSVLSGRLSGRLGLPKIETDLFWYGNYQHRFVPDSTEAEYDDFRFNAELSRFGADGYISLEAETQLKDYAQPGDTNDYSALFARADLGRNFGHDLDGSVSTSFEDHWYKIQDYTNRNYRLLRGSFAITQQIGHFNLGPLVRLEFCWEDELDLNGGSYGQWGVGGIAGLVRLGTLFCSLEATSGRRDYRGQDPAISSYKITSVSIMIDYAFWKNYSFNLLFDGDFESHDSAADDANLYLLTAGLRVRL